MTATLLQNTEQTNLVEKMIAQHQYPLLSELPIDSFLAEHENVVLFFTHDVVRYPESNDVAMILPELVSYFNHSFTPAVISMDIQDELQNTYGFLKWPALVFLRNSNYLGHICKVQDWSDYISQITAILKSKPKPAPGFIIPVKQ